MARVFVVCNTERFNMETAEEYGRVHFLNPAFSPFRPEEFINDLINQIQEAEFDYEVDYIAITGPALHLTLFAGIMFSSYPYLRVLMFGAKSNSYNERIVQCTKMSNV